MACCVCWHLNSVVIPPWLGSGARGCVDDDEDDDDDDDASSS